MTPVSDSFQSGAALRGRSPLPTKKGYLGLGSNPAAKLRLFCFPSAGSAASMYREWRMAELKNLEVVAIELPGRERRIRERLLYSIESIVDDIVPNLPQDREFAFFGHSMGALVAFEVARALTFMGSGPLALFASACPAPHLSVRPARHLLPDDQLARETGDLNGTPPEIFLNPEMRDMVLSQIRADMTALETYVYVDAPPLECSLVAFGGLSDAEVPSGELDEWRRHTTAEFHVRTFEGDHFYLHGAKDLLLREIESYSGRRAETAVLGNKEKSI